MERVDTVLNLMMRKMSIEIRSNEDRVSGILRVELIPVRNIKRKLSLFEAQQ